MRENLKTTNEMEMEFIIIEMGIGNKESMRTTSNMEKASTMRKKEEKNRGFILGERG